MTVQTPSSVTPQYVGNGVTTVFAYGFKIFAAADLVVTQTDTAGVETTLALTTHYTLSGVGDAAGGNITLLTALPTNYLLVARAVLALTQQTDLRNQGTYQAEIHEDVFDRLTKIDQQQQEQIGRSIKLSNSEVGSAVATTLPAVAIRKSKFLAFDANGNVIAAAGTSANLGPVSAFIDTLLDDADAATARTTLGAMPATNPGILSTLVNAKGDIIVATADDAVDRKAVGSNGQALTADSTQADGLKYIFLSALFGSRGLTGANNSGTPNTQYDLAADFVALRDSNNNVVVRSNTGTLTNNVLTAGPAANGRDQSGVFSAGSWVHFYLIWNGTTLATLSSATAPPTGPALPTGYTHYYYVGAVRFNGSSQLVATLIRGDKAFLNPAINALASGAATTETAVDLTAIIPPNALDWEGLFKFGDDNSGSSGETSLALRLLTGVAWWTKPATTARVNHWITQLRVPNVAQQIYYLWPDGAPQTDADLDIDVTGYRMPNGGA